ncbi:unnamed protein product [Absidia cylindrospora]
MPDAYQEQYCKKDEAGDVYLLCQRAWTFLPKTSLVAKGGGVATWCTQQQSSTLPPWKSFKTATAKICFMNFFGKDLGKLDNNERRTTTYHQHYGVLIEERKDQNTVNYWNSWRTRILSLKAKDTTYIEEDENEKEIFSQLLAKASPPQQQPQQWQ